MKRIITLLLAVMTAVSLVACGDKSSATVDAAGLGKALAERVQFDTALSAIDAGDYLELPEKCEASAYMSDGSTVEEIFVVQCSDKTDASAVKVSMQSLLDSQKQEMERYKPEEVARLDNAILATSGTGVVLCWAAMYGAALNVVTNTRLMKDRLYAQRLNDEVDRLMNKYWQLAEETYDRVYRELKKPKKKCWSNRKTRKKRKSTDSASASPSPCTKNVPWKN